MKKALITGITGQDGAYLSEFLLGKGYEVHGVVRRVALEDSEHRLWRIRHILDKVILHPASLESYASIFNVVEKVMPDECYHLAAQSYVDYSFGDEFSTFNTNINGTMYVISKVAGSHITQNYREAYNIFACNGILFNHESPRRGFEFVTRKITNAVARIKLGLSRELKLGNLEAKRDWGFSGDYVEAMWLMLQQAKPEDYVIATGEAHSVKDFAKLAFSFVGLNWEDYVVVDETFYRPAEVTCLQGDYSKAKKELGWRPRVKFKDLVEMMVSADLERVKKMK